MDGYATRSQNIFKAQRHRGWNPVILTSPKHEEDLTNYNELQEEIDGFRFYRSGRNPVRLPVLAELTLIFILFIRMVHVIRQERPAVLHSHSPVLNCLPALVAGLIFRLPVVYEIRAFWEDAGVDQETYQKQSIKFKCVKLLETLACKTVPAVAVLSNGIRDDLIKRGVASNKITPVFNGIHPENFKPIKPDLELIEEWNLSGKKTIGFIGSFYRYEGLDLLINAFSKIERQHPNLILLLVGGGEVEKKLRYQIKQLNLEKKVCMPGKIPHNRIQGVYAIMDILIYPRYSIRLTELVTPLKPLEAMAMKKAVIASDIGGHRELITNKQTGFLFKAGDPCELAGAMCEVLSDIKLADELKKNGYMYVLKKKTWEKTTSVYNEIYSGLSKRFSYSKD